MYKLGLLLEDIEKIIYNELLQQCKMGLPAAFSSLYHRHVKELFNTIYRIVQHSGEAEDILQDTFIAAFKGIEQFELKSSFSAWIKRIAINQSISALRKLNFNLSVAIIQGYNGSETIISSLEKSSEVDERTKGLKSISRSVYLKINNDI